MAIGCDTTENKNTQNLASKLVKAVSVCVTE